eukprot:scaffold2622_cov32-Phaeocystis_antarctica.AAC.2
MVRRPRTVAATRMAICTMLTHPRPPIRTFATLHLDRLGRAIARCHATQRRERGQGSGDVYGSNAPLRATPRCEPS